MNHFLKPNVKKVHSLGSEKRLERFGSGGHTRPLKTTRVYINCAFLYTLCSMKDNIDILVENDYHIVHSLLLRKLQRFTSFSIVSFITTWLVFIFLKHNALANLELKIGVKNEWFSIFARCLLSLLNLGDFIEVKNNKISLLAKKTS